MEKCYIDIHNHMAWEVDDGMDSKENAIKALRDAKEDGVHTLIATPHYVPGQYGKEDVAQIHARVEELIELGESMGVSVYEGAELFLNSGYLDMLDEKMCPTLANSRYLLCEFDVRKELSKREEAVEEKLYEIKVRGYLPLIAHVERYFHTKVDIERVKEWVAMGYGIQVNRTSLLGMHGNTCQENAIRLLEHSLVHVIASDTHRSSGGRICKMSDVYDFLTKRYGEEAAQALCIDNPKNILQNKQLKIVNITKRSRFAKIFKRS